MILSFFVLFRVLPKIMHNSIYTKLAKNKTHQHCGCERRETQSFNWMYCCLYKAYSSASDERETILLANRSVCKTLLICIYQHNMEVCLCRVMLAHTIKLGKGKQRQADF